MGARVEDLAILPSRTTGVQQLPCIAEHGHIGCVNAGVAKRAQVIKDGDFFSFSAGNATGALEMAPNKASDAGGRRCLLRSVPDQTLAGFKRAMKTGGRESFLAREIVT